MNDLNNVCVSEVRSVDDWLNPKGFGGGEGDSCAKSFNSSASQFAVQVRSCLGYPIVHFGTIMVDSWEGGREGVWGGGGGGGHSKSC